MSQDTSAQERVQQLVVRTAKLWWESDASTLPPRRTYSRRRQADNEGNLDRFLSTLDAEALRPPRSEPARQAVRERLVSEAALLGRSALDLEKPHTNLLHASGFLEAATAFAQRARQFDPQLRGEEIFQASRNAWVMFSLQMLMGQPVQLTPAILGYSLLYPYVDNFLDSAVIPVKAKEAFSERLAQRFAEPDLPSGNTLERKVWDLVGLIEEQYGQAEHPQVFENLLAIQRAQSRSVGLLRRDASPYEVDVLSLSLEKAGASVVASGYLVAGSLSEAEHGSLFGFGAFLQLTDDLQDVRENREDGLLTVFSQTAEHWPLDGVTTRTFQFGDRVLEGLACFNAPDLEPLKELIGLSIDLLLLEAASRCGRFYSRAYLRELESRFPVRFSKIGKVNRRLNRRRKTLAGLAEALMVPASPE